MGLSFSDRVHISRFSRARLAAMCLPKRICPPIGTRKVKAMASEGKKTSPGEFVRQVRTEASKVVWPSRQETVTTSIMVFILMTILAIFFLTVDSIFGAIVKWLLTLA
jgi:protein translocase subunit secE/sec61 gamma